MPLLFCVFSGGWVSGFRHYPYAVLAGHGADGGLWGISWGCAMWFIYWGPSGMVAGEAIIISITGGFCPDCSWPLSTGGAGKLTGCHHGMMCKPCTGVFLRSGTFIYLYANLHSCIVTGLQPLRHFQRIALPAYHPAFFIP